MGRTTRIYKIVYDGTKPHWDCWSCSLVKGATLDLVGSVLEEGELSFKWPGYGVVFAYAIGENKKEAYYAGAKLITDWLEATRPEEPKDVPVIKETKTLAFILRKFFGSSNTF